MKVADGQRIKWNLSLAQRAFSNIVSDMNKGGSAVQKFQERLAQKRPPPTVQPPHTPITKPVDVNESDESEFGITIQNESNAVSPWDDERYKDMLDTLKNRALTFDEFRKLAALNPEASANDNVTNLPAWENGIKEDT